MTNPPEKIVVVGGGFAGVRLLRSLASSSLPLRLTLVDPRREAVFLPLLPDVLAGKIKLDRLLFSLPDFCRGRAIEFIAGRAAGLKENRLLLADGRELPFDHLVLSCGATPNFYGNEAARKIAYPLYGAADCRRLLERLAEVARAGKPHNFLVVGGGYTGTETATALAYYFRKKSEISPHPPVTIRIIETAPQILSGLPPEVAGPARAEVERYGVSVTAESELKVSNEEGVEVSGEKVRDFTLIWTAGVRTVDFIQNLPFARDKQGRLIVDPTLLVSGTDRICALGDCASFKADSKPLRMAVQFSWAEGRVAAANILGLHQGRPPLPYRPRDLGYLIPLASWKAWGNVLGIPVGGRIGSFLHYLMCVWRTRKAKNRWKIVSDLLKKNGNSLK